MTPSSTARKVRSRLLQGLFAGLTVALTVGFMPAASQAQTAEPADVGVLAAHKSPFNCGKVFDANNWSPGHDPSGAIDWQTRGSDAIGGETVRATASGTARFSTTLPAPGEMGILQYGNYVTITHGDGTITRYAHLASMVRNPGQSLAVSQGTAIGTVGGTGGPGGGNYPAHLHYEQRSASGVLDTSPTVEGITVSLGQEKAITSTNACSGGGNPYTPQEVCGTGYGVVDQAALSAGTVYLLYNNDNGNNCVVTLKSTSLGTPSAVAAFLEPQGSSRTTDSGSFSYYAGPVRRAAPGVCVKWGGTAGSSYTSPFEHCGS